MATRRAVFRRGSDRPASVARSIGARKRLLTEPLAAVCEIDPIDVLEELALQAVDAIVDRTDTG